jgi:hypothetical protein
MTPLAGWIRNAKYKLYLIHRVNACGHSLNLANKRRQNLYFARVHSLLVLCGADGLRTFPFSCKLYAWLAPIRVPENDNTDSRPPPAGKVIQANHGADYSENHRAAYSKRSRPTRNKREFAGELWLSITYDPTLSHNSFTFVRKLYA